MKCPNCGKEMVMHLAMSLRLPAKYAHGVTKKVLRSKEVQICGIDWDNATASCYPCGIMEGV